MLRNLLATGAMVLLSATSSMAQNADKAACTAEVKAKCESAPTGGGGKVACIQQNMSTFSDSCQAALAGAVAQAKAACGADVDKICPGVKPGGGAILNCVKPHLAEVSKPCKDAIAQAIANSQ
jgi:hypothetical protein